MQYMFWLVFITSVRFYLYISAYFKHFQFWGIFYSLLWQKRIFLSYFVLQRSYTSYNVSQMQFVQLFLPSLFFFLYSQCTVVLVNHWNHKCFSFTTCIQMGFPPCRVEYGAVKQCKQCCVLGMYLSYFHYSTFHERQQTMFLVWKSLSNLSIKQNVKSFPRIFVKW
jgi:hypothetical protein